MRSEDEVRDDLTRLALRRLDVEGEREDVVAELAAIDNRRQQLLSELSDIHHADCT